MCEKCEYAKTTRLYAIVAESSGMHIATDTATGEDGKVDHYRMKVFIMVNREQIDATREVIEYATKEPVGDDFDGYLYTYDREGAMEEINYMCSGLANLAGNPHVKENPMVFEYRCN